LVVNPHLLIFVTLTLSDVTNEILDEAMPESNNSYTCVTQPI